MSKIKKCKKPGCGCGYEKTTYEDNGEEENLCQDDKTPLLCDMPDTPCKWGQILCKHKAYDEDDEGFCYAARDGVNECPLQIDDLQGEPWSFQKTIIKSPYWGFNGFHYYTGQYLIDEKIIKAIFGWAGDCTEPSMDTYRDPDSMFNALDLIYKLLDESEKKALIIKIENRFDGEKGKVYLKKTKLIKNKHAHQLAKEDV